MSVRGYMARNLDVANAYGLEANLSAIEKRMVGKRFPRWLRESLADAHRRATKSIRPLIEYRDELTPDPRDLRGYVPTMLGDDTLSQLDGGAA